MPRHDYDYAHARVYHGGRGSASNRHLNHQIRLPARQWRALNMLGLKHGCTAGEIIEGLLNTHLNNYAAKLPQHLAALRGRGE